MQDNQWDDQFVDHGWQEMRKLLDREMPVLPWWRRRRAGWPALLLLLGLGLGAVYFLGGEDGRRVPEPVAASGEQPVAGVAPAEENLKPSGADGDAVARMTVPETKSNTEFEKANSSPGSEAEKNPDEYDPAGRSGAGLPPNSIIVENAFDKNEASLAAEALSQPEEQKQTAASQRPASNSISTQAEEPHLAAFDLLPTLNMTLNSAFAPSLSQPGEMKIRRSSSLFPVPGRFGVRAAVLTSREGFGSGVELGLSAAYRFGASRWSLQTGLGYAFQQRHFYRPGWGAMEESSPVATPQQPGREQDGVEAVRASLPPGGSLGANTHRLSLPANIQFRIGRRWSISTGATVAYVFSARQKNQVYFQRPPNSFSLNLDSQTYRLLNTGVNQSINEELLRNWEFGINGGLSFRPHRRILLKLEYHHGLTDLVRSDYYESYNRYLGFGLGYLLK